MTLKEVKKLTDEDLRIKVAELCGWRKDPSRKGVWSPPTRPGFVATKLEHLPSYTTDLNAIDEAVLAHREKIESNYPRWLRVVVVEDARKKHGFVLRVVTFNNYNATARQRAEAFVLTMEGSK